MIALDDARRVIAAAEDKAREIGPPMNIAVVAAGGNLTPQLAESSQPGEQFFGIHASNHGRIMIFASGIPLRRDGSIIGAIGVRGGTGSQNDAVISAGARLSRVDRFSTPLA